MSRHSLARDGDVVGTVEVNRKSARARTTKPPKRAASTAAVRAATLSDRQQSRLPVAGSCSCSEPPANRPTSTGGSTHSPPLSEAGSDGEVTGAHTVYHPEWARRVRATVARDHVRRYHTHDLPLGDDNGRSLSATPRTPLAR
jgi:hypothetical protein